VITDGRPLDALRYEVLGPVAVKHRNGMADLGYPKVRGALAVLLCRENRRVSTNTLTEELWADCPPKSAIKNIQLYICRLRRALGDARRIVREGAHCYRLVVSPGELDVHRFDQLIAHGHRFAGDDPERAVQAYRGALSLWRDDNAYAGMADIPCVQAERHRLAEKRQAVWLDAVDIDVRLGRSQQLIPELREITERHPYQERAWVHLMTALNDSGRRVEALDAYHTVFGLLRDEVGLEPCSELQDLQRAILRGEPSQRASNSRSVAATSVGASSAMK
jgi:DNA-binding SARP family transcriptional activator